MKISPFFSTLSHCHHSGTCDHQEIFDSTLCQSLYNMNEIYGENIDYQYGAIFNENSTRWGYINFPVPRANGYSSGNVLDLEVSVTDTNGNMWC